MNREHLLRMEHVHLAVLCASIYLACSTSFSVAKHYLGGVKLRDAKRNSLFLTAKLISGEDNLILFQALWFCCAYSFFLNLVSGWPVAEESRDGVACRDRKKEVVLKN